ncbi:hypothetical protein AAFC00_001201 [Neodothiora populina]|uniref:Zn(2)-C6 fungal-type domain-containing protein n=1 Tax=Neodothiora populina TaxID=2781224 RepID=A0ABR3PN40_9PEZI
MTILKAETASIMKNGGSDGVSPSGSTVTASGTSDQSSPGRTKSSQNKRTVRTSQCRSKTGCLTCRRRKKKCDERKPSCWNCTKNNVYCLGYEERRDWGSKAQHSKSIRPTPPLPQMIAAVDNALDQQLLSFYMSDLSHSLNIYNSHHNPFTHLVVPLALRDAGLMHSVLSLSSSCLIARQERPSCELLVRQSHHFGLAIVDLRQHLNVSSVNTSVGSTTDCTMIRTILHCLESSNAGNSNGEYRCHLQATQRLVLDYSQSSSAEVHDFGRRFVNYQNIANSIMSLRPVHHPPFVVPPGLAGSLEQPTLMSSHEAPPFQSLLTPIESLLETFISLRHLRDGIRTYRSSGTSWFSNAHLLHLIFAIDESLQSWKCPSVNDTSQYHAALLYRQCAWIYLFRTIRPSVPSAELEAAVNEGIRHVYGVLRDADIAIPTTSHSVNTSSAATGEVLQTEKKTTGSSKDTQQQARLQIILPFLVVLGCAAFGSRQREMIRPCFQVLRERCLVGNIQVARSVVEGMWGIMDTSASAAAAATYTTTTATTTDIFAGGRSHYDEMIGVGVGAVGCFDWTTNINEEYGLGGCSNEQQRQQQLQRDEDDAWDWEQCMSDMGFDVLIS